MLKALHHLWLIALILCPIVLWILPADSFDETGVLTCPSRAWFDIECLGCGITRAVMYFHNFDFTSAIFYNSLVLLVYPFLVWLWQLWVRAELKYLGIWEPLWPRPSGSK